MGFKTTDVFGTQSCRRCGGSGRHSFNTRDGSMCYGCNGAGRNWTRKDQPYAEDFVTALRAYTHSTFEKLRPGDVFCHPDDMIHPFRGDSRPKAGARFLRAETVTDIPGTPEAYSTRAGIGAEPNVRWTYHGWVEVTTDGGGEPLKASHAACLYRRFNLESVLALCKKPETVARVRAHLAVEEAKAAYAGRAVSQPAPAEAPASAAQLTVRMALKKLPLGDAQAAVEAVAGRLKKTARLGVVWGELPEFARAAIAEAAARAARGVVGDACVACGKPVYEGEDESTYCGTVHSGCLDAHLAGCEVCDVDGQYHQGEAAA
jgi:hypothetical protein